MKGHPGAQRGRRRVPHAAYGAVLLLFGAVALLHLRRSWHAVPECDGLQESGWATSRRRPAATSREGFEEVFATLFALEMQDLLSIREDGPLPPTDGKHELSAVVQGIKVVCHRLWLITSKDLCRNDARLGTIQLLSGTCTASHCNASQEQGVGVLFISVKWFFQQPSPDAFNFRVMDYVVQTVCGQGLRLSIVLDAQANPPWVFDVVPDAGLVDSKGIGYRTISFNHPAVMQLVNAWYAAVLVRLQQLNATCIHSIQPCFNNEYETKYIQVGAWKLQRPLGSIRAFHCVL